MQHILLVTVMAREVPWSRGGGGAEGLSIKAVSASGHRSLGGKGGGQHCPGLAKRKRRW